MSDMKKNHHPYKILGKKLKTMRQRLQESLGETSGAVEIQVEQLDRFERGVEAPSEDILLLLISHFGLQDEEAVTLWELAGYERASRFMNEEEGFESLDAQQARQMIPVMLLAIDSRVLYSNGVEVDIDQQGVVLHFSQTNDIPAGNAATNGKAKARTTISKVGMSHEQAEQLLSTLQQAMLRKKYLSGPKQLPPNAS